eukprot:10555958-Lingulodinium_polyedra.AAC.1
MRLGQIFVLQREAAVAELEGGAAVDVRAELGPEALGLGQVGHLDTLDPPRHQVADHAVQLRVVRDEEAIGVPAGQRVRNARENDLPS